MGRKEGQRTKGNTKVNCEIFQFIQIYNVITFSQPSSSARSAELLTSSDGKSKNAIENVDFSATIFGLKPFSAEEDALIPDELKLALKKMSKKDETTKLKVRHKSKGDEEISK